jgi:hypothetical protein
MFLGSYSKLHTICIRPLTAAVCASILDLGANTRIHTIFFAIHLCTHIESGCDIAIMSRPSFFDLPLELREEIYKGVLFAPGQGPDILRTCHDMHTETRKCLYQKPLIFRSQHALYKWLEKTPRELLVYVSNITIRIQDVDLKPILDTGTFDSLERIRPRLLTPAIYQAEVKKLEQSLKSIPHVRTITIRAQSPASSFLYRDFMTHLLKVLGKSCPGLLDLHLEGEFFHQELQFLSSLKRLESFSFDGFSSSSPVAVAEILAKLKQLRSLALISKCTPSTRSIEPYVEGTLKVQSFPSDVVRAISQLASFSVFESVPASSQNLFFTPEVLSSLHDHKTLKHLSVKLSQGPDIMTLTSLDDFLNRTSIESLELDWPDLDPLLLEQHHILGRDLKILWIRADSEADAAEILWSIADSYGAGESKKLNKVVLIRSTKYKAKAQDAIYDRIGCAIRMQSVSLSSFAHS